MICVGRLRAVAGLAPALVACALLAAAAGAAAQTNAPSLPPVPDEAGNQALSDQGPAPAPSEAGNVVAPAPAAPPAPPPPLTVADGKAIEAALLAAPEFPPPPGAVGASAGLEASSPEKRAAAQAVLIQAAIALARAERGVIDNPRALDSDWALKPPYNAEASFNAARVKGEVAAWVQALPRRSKAYLNLLAARQNYQKIVDQGGWPTLSGGETLRQGSKGPAVRALRERLAIEGYDATGGPPDHFEDTLAAAVTDFRLRHDLTGAPVVDSDTIAALNVPAAQRLQTLIANLERARWLPDPLPDYRVVADIAQAHVWFYKAGDLVMSMRAVVGDPDHKTPIFASRMSTIVFNPPWTVPMSIAKAELYPAEQRSPGYLRSRGFVETNGYLVQKAGPNAALGYVKFNMPNDFSVYLHDTPSRAAFGREQRMLSHGCVRVEKPRDMAAAILADQGWTREHVDDVIADRATIVVTPKPGPDVFIVYTTAYADSSGKVSFRPDIYRWDAKLAAAVQQVSAQQ